MANSYAHTCRTCANGRRAADAELRRYPNGEPDMWRTHWCKLLSRLMEPGASPNSCVLQTPMGCRWIPRPGRKRLSG